MPQRDGRLTRMSPSARRTLQVVGAVALVLGLLLFFGAFLPFVLAMAGATGGDPSEAAFGGVIRSFVISVLLSGAGFVLLVVGGLCAYFGFMRPVAELTAAETGDALAYTGQRVARGVGTGLAESGVLGPRMSSVRVRCRSCGALDTEDARFCSACGAAV